MQYLCFIINTFSNKYLAVLSIFIFCIFDGLAFGSLILEELAFPELVNSQRQQRIPLQAHLPYTHRPIQSLHPNQLVYQILTQYSSHSKSAGLGQLGTASTVHSLWKLFKLLNPRFSQCSHPALPIPFPENLIKSSGSCSLPSAS